MFLKTHTESDRLAVWRKFRHTFPESGTVEDALDAFSTINPLPRCIDYYTPENWPDVFEIIKHNLLCQSGLTLIVASTLLHLQLVKTENLRFDVVSNHITGNTGLVFVCDGLCYNFLPGKVVTLEFAEANSTSFGQHIIALDKFIY
jgi:hypothetical protein